MTSFHVEPIIFLPTLLCLPSECTSTIQSFQMTHAPISAAVPSTTDCCHSKSISSQLLRSRNVGIFSVVWTPRAGAAQRVFHALKDETSPSQMPPNAASAATLHCRQVPKDGRIPHCYAAIHLQKTCAWCEQACVFHNEFLQGSHRVPSTSTQGTHTAEHTKEKNGTDMSKHTHGTAKRDETPFTL